MLQPPLVERPYQREAIDFLKATPRALLALDTRLGKSFCALTAALELGLSRILILAPAIGRLSWAVECNKVGIAPQVFGPGTKPALMRPPTFGPIVLAYDALSRKDSGWTAVLGRPWDLVILDECQYLKTDGSNRTRAVYDQIAPEAARVWLLSGTPTPNHAGEIYPHVAALWPHLALGGRHAFENRYCRVHDTPFGRRIDGSRNVAELRGKLAPYVHRKRKHEVVPELPRMAHNLVPLDLAPASANAMGTFNRDDDELERLLASPLNARDAEGLRDATGGPSLARSLGEAKTPAVAAWAAEQLDGVITGKLVLFAWHRTVLEELFERLADYEPVRIDGATSEAAKRRAVDLFQTRPATRLFLGQIRACGTAIALDAADDVAFAEPSWTPQDNYQAASRIENVGRRSRTTVSWLYVPGTLDERIMDILRRKTRDISALWD